MTHDLDFDLQWASFLAGLPEQILLHGGRWAAYRDGEWRIRDTEDAALADACGAWGLRSFVIAKVEIPEPVHLSFAGRQLFW
jgi:hypothetical protein